MFLLDSGLASKDWVGLEKHILEILTKYGAETVYSEKWPDRRLAYEVRGCKKGTYYLTYFNAPRGSITEIRRDVQLSERILRALFIQEEGIEDEMVGRRNKEIEIPPAELSFGRDHTESGYAERRSRAGGRRDDPPPRRDGGGGGRPGGEGSAAPRARTAAAPESDDDKEKSGGSASSEAGENGSKD
jgi:ribosomal protein S6